MQLRGEKKTAMNKRQWKKHLKKRKLRWEAAQKRLGIDKWFSNIFFENLLAQISNETISDDCGIRIERRKPMILKVRELGHNENLKGDNGSGREENV
jgi:hypothetical protein